MDFFRSEYGLEGAVGFIGCQDILFTRRTEYYIRIIKKPLLRLRKNGLPNLYRQGAELTFRRGWSVISELV